MNKSLIMIVAIAFFANLYSTDGSWNSSNMEASGRDAFGGNWLFRKRIDLSAYGVWGSELRKGLNLVRNYARKDKKLSDYVAKIEQTESDLFGTIILTYSNLFLPLVRKFLVKQDIVQKSSYFKEKFDLIIDTMADMLDEVRIQKQTVKGKDISRAYTIIEEIAVIIMNVAKKAVKSIDAELAGFEE